MPLEAFRPTSSVVGILTGGVTAVDRSLLLSHGTAQTQAVQSIQTILALALMQHSPNLTPPHLTDALRRPGCFNGQERAPQRHNRCSK